MTTFLAIAENSKLNFTSFSCRATGVLELVDKQFLMTEVLLEPVVGVGQASDRDKALRVLQKAEQACLISNSIKSKISVTPWVKEAELKQTA